MQNTCKIHANTKRSRVSVLAPVRFLDLCVSACIEHVFSCIGNVFGYSILINPDFPQILGVNGFASICMYRLVLVCMIMYLFVFNIKHSLLDDQTARPPPMS